MALLVANSLKTPGQSDMALGRSVSAIWSLMQKTCERGAPELLLVNEQTQIDAPGTVFEAVVHGL